MPPHGFRRTYGLEAFGAADFSRARELLGACPHLSGFGIADASNVVLAARYDTTDIYRAVATSASSPTTFDYRTLADPRRRENRLRVPV
jgi:hypothetical protein